MDDCVSPKPEFSRLFDLDHLDGAEATMAGEADESERQALARRFDLISLDRLAFEARVEAIEATGATHSAIRLTVQFSADVVQACVVSLAPVKAHHSEQVVIEYLRAPVDEKTSAAVTFTPDEPDPPEFLDSDKLDVGEVVAEHLALALEPYPRHPDAERLRAEEGLELPSRTNDDDHPFAALGKFKGDGAG